MRVLDQKLLRDLRRLSTQALAIALVMACGAAVIILAAGASRSLEQTGEAFYDRYRFATVFASAIRAPAHLQTSIRALPDVSSVETRIVESVLLDIDGMQEPASALALSIPEHRQATVNRLYVRLGRLPEPTRVGEVAVAEAFAQAHGFVPGDSFHANMNGKRRLLTITGIVLSPEFVYAIGPGDMVPDQRRFGVLFMPESAMTGIFDLHGSFNNVVMTTQRGANLKAIITALDALLKPYGGTGAHDRSEQISNSFLQGELTQLRAMAAVIPPVFLLISAFLVNMILSRLVALEREQIGLLKALGYANATIAWHYAKLVIAISCVGLVIGAAIGTWLGQALTRLYVEFFSFPFLVFNRSPDLYVIAGSVTVLAALTGAAKAIFSVVTLPPATAMRPPLPARYRRLMGKSRPSSRLVSQLSIMALRHLWHWPVRTGITILGTSLSVALLITALFSYDSIELMIDTVYFQQNRHDATLAFGSSADPSAVQDILTWPGILKAEPFRNTSVLVRNEHRQERLSIVGIPASADLSRILDHRLRPMDASPSGLTVSEEVAEKLGVTIGDQVEITLLEAADRIVKVTVTAISKEFIGLPVYMRLDALNSLLPGGPRVSGVRVSIDAEELPAIYQRVKASPVIQAVALMRISLVKFREMIDQNILIMAAIYCALAIVITFGVIYNSARIQLSERARELASLRVFGFTRSEVSSVLLLELAVIVLAAQPLGWVLGYGFSWLVSRGFASDLFRIPLVVDSSTAAIASLVVMSTAVACMLIVRRRIDRLDLVSVLKTRE